LNTVRPVPVSSANTDVFEKAKTEMSYQTLLLYYGTGYLYVLPTV